MYPGSRNWVPARTEQVAASSATGRLTAPPTLVLCGWRQRWGVGNDLGGAMFQTRCRFARRATGDVRLVQFQHRFNGCDDEVERRA